MPKRWFTLGHPHRAGNIRCFKYREALERELANAPVLDKEYDGT